MTDIHTCSREEAVSELLLCATNDGPYYERFLKCALLDTYLTNAERMNNWDQYVHWTREASSYMRHYEHSVNGALLLDSGAFLAFSLALRDHYMNHLSEWQLVDIVALAHKLGYPGLQIAYKG